MILFLHLSLKGNQYLIFLHITKMNLIALKGHYIIILTEMLLLKGFQLTTKLKKIYTNDESY